MLRQLLLALLLAAPTTALAATTALTTVSERSGFTKTGRYAEVVALCDAFARRYPDAVRCESFGTTPEGRPMTLLVASRSGALDPATARRQGLPVLLVQGGIHAGEIDGKDAGFLLLRQLLDGEAAPGALEKLVMVFVPVFNVDGHERFGRWNRPNQRGPEEMGWRTTAQNLNLNRDYLKADAPEMQAMLRLVGKWDPIVAMDLHATNGAQFEHDISITGEPVNSGDPELRKVGRAVRDGIIERLSGQGSLPLAFYPSFVQYDDPSSGFEDGVAPPRFSHGYFPLRNRIGILVETHSWKTYPERVRATRNTVLNLVEMTAAQGREWMQVAKAADQRALRIGGEQVPLDYKATDKVRTIDFRGYAYTRTPSEVSGALMTRYDESKPETWKVPLKDEIVPDTVVRAPRGGYVVPAAFASTVEPLLQLHGLDYRRLDEGIASAAVQAFRADEADFAPGSLEGHQRLTVAGQWADERHDVPTGSLFVPIAQPKVRLVMAVLEPQAPDSIAAWGGFNNAFERKEYMEDYVAEAVARDMLADDPALKEAFERRLGEDPEFAGSARARLEFFYRRHSSYDERYRLYPVLRSDVVID